MFVLFSLPKNSKEMRSVGLSYSLFLPSTQVGARVYTSIHIQTCALRTVVPVWSCDNQLKGVWNLCLVRIFNSTV